MPGNPNSGGGGLNLGPYYAAVKFVMGLSGGLPQRRFINDPGPAPGTSMQGAGPGSVNRPGPLRVAAATPRPGTVTHPTTIENRRQGRAAAPGDQQTAAVDDKWNTREQIILKVLSKLAERYAWAAYLWRLYLAGSIMIVLEDIRKNHDKYWHDYQVWEEQQARTSAPVIRAPGPGRIPRQTVRLPPGGHSRVVTVPDLEPPAMPAPGRAEPSVFEPIPIFQPHLPMPRKVVSPRSRAAAEPQLDPVVISTARLPMPAPVPRAPSALQRYAGYAVKAATLYGLVPKRSPSTKVKLRGFPGQDIGTPPLTGFQNDPLSSLALMPALAPETAKGKCKCAPKKRKSGKPACRNPRTSSRTFTRDGQKYRSTTRRIECQA